MQGLVSGRSLAAGLIGFLLLASSVAVAETEAELRAKIESLERQVAALTMQDTAVPASIRAEQSAKVTREMLDDSAEHADFDIVWRNGVWVVSGERFKAHVGGRVFFDIGWANGKPLARDLTGEPTIRDGSEFRNVRILAEGTLYKYIEYRMEAGWEGDAFLLHDAWIQMIDVPFVGNVQVGHFKEPFSLEEQTDSLFITFMERHAGNALVPGRNPGIMLHDAILGEAGQERMTWAIGVFRMEEVGMIGATPQQGTLINSDGGYALAMRVTGLPWYADGGAKLAHVGLAYSVRTPPYMLTYGVSEAVRFQAKPEAHFVQLLMLDTGIITNVDNVNTFGAEAAVVYDAFSLQMEYIGMRLDTDEDPSQGVLGQRVRRFQENPCFNSFYVEASYFITGEHRVYDHERGAFKRVSPKKNFREDGGWGAVQVATRYSYLDLDDEYHDNRGELNCWTLGVNWYLNPNVRVMANYIRACPDRLDTANAADIFMMRFQWDF